MLSLPHIWDYGNFSKSQTLLFSGCEVTELLFRGTIMVSVQTGLVDGSHHGVTQEQVQELHFVLSKSREWLRHSLKFLLCPLCNHTEDFPFSLYRYSPRPIMGFQEYIILI